MADPDRDAVLKAVRAGGGQYGKREIAKALKLKGDDRIALKRVLKDMTEDGDIVQSGRRTYSVPAADEAEGDDRHDEHRPGPAREDPGQHEVDADHAGAEAEDGVGEKLAFLLREAAHHRGDAELLLDAVLIDQNPGLIDRYYDAFQEIDPFVTQQATNRMTTRETDQLRAWLVLFHKEAFLRDYPDPQRMHLRLNQVMKRVKLQPLPEGTISVLKTGREIVEKRLDDLLPPEHF